VFIDIDSIPYGSDFRDHIQEVLRRSDVFLAVIGRDWLGEHADGGRRIDEPKDVVRAEVETALQLGLPLIPLLVDGAHMPAAEALPDSIAPLHFLNAATIATGRDFHVHMDRLIASIDTLLAKKHGKAPPPAAATSPRAPGGERLQHLALGLAPAAGVVALPFVAALGVLTPPWPPAAAPLTAIVCALAVLIVHRLSDDAALRLVRLIMIVAGAVALLAGAGYAAGASLYAYQPPKADRLSAKGFECTKDALLVYKDKCPALGPDELAGAEYNAGYLWTPGSIGEVTAGLGVLWFGGFIALGVLAGGFLVLHQRSAPPARAGPQRPTA